MTTATATTATAPVLTASSGSATAYTDAEFQTLLTAGISPSVIVSAAIAAVPHGTLLQWHAAKANLPQQIATHQAAQSAAREAAQSAPIRIRAGRDAGTILRAGKSKGKPGEATGALLEISGSPRFAAACTPGQIVTILRDPVTAITLATETDAGLHDGQGYSRDQTYSVAAHLDALATAYGAFDLSALDTIPCAPQPSSTATA